MRPPRVVRHGLPLWYRIVNRRAEVLLRTIRNAQVREARHAGEDRRGNGVLGGRSVKRRCVCLMLCRTRSYIRRFRIVRRPGEGKKGANVEGKSARGERRTRNAGMQRRGQALTFYNKSVRADFAANRNNLVYVESRPRDCLIGAGGLFEEFNSSLRHVIQYLVGRALPSPCHSVA